jgi:asparagine synthase (glutamine-hydrolysing)
MTREHVKVALNGDAGDENFAGYDRYLGAALALRYEWLPHVLRKLLVKTVAVMPEGGHVRGLYRRGKRFLATASMAPKRRYAQWVSIFSDTWKRELYTPAFREVMTGHDSIDLIMHAYETAGTSDFVDATMAVDVTTYLPDDLLVKVDIASMAHSLEARSPMVDHLFMEFAASVPSSLKLRGRIKKYILKQAVKALLPAAVIERPKMGFGVPLDHWFRHELRDMAYDVLLSRRSLDRGLFQQQTVQLMLDEHTQGRGKWDANLWSLLFLELWMQRFIDSRAHP